MASQPEVEDNDSSAARAGGSQDALALIAVLRGPLFGISDPELFAFKQAGGWFSLFHERSDAKQKLDRFTGAIGTLPCANTTDGHASFRRRPRWTAFLKTPVTWRWPRQHLAGVDAGDVLHAVDRVRQVVEAGGSLADAADALEADSEATNEVESLPLEPGRTDVVSLMNLHKAKGLEADVVFLADPAGGVMPRVDVHIERTGVKAVGWLKIVRKSEDSFSAKLLGEHADWPAHEAAELPYLQAEEDRLLYVAATRARGALVVSRSVQKIRTPAWGALSGFLKEAVELPVPSTVSVPSVEPLDCRPATRKRLLISKPRHTHSWTKHHGP